MPQPPTKKTEAITTLLSHWHFVSTKTNIAHKGLRKCWHSNYSEIIIIILLLLRVFCNEKKLVLMSLVSENTVLKFAFKFQIFVSIYSSKGKIKNIFAEGGISSSAVMVLVNAVYFKGKWESAFTKSDTIKCHFRSPKVWGPLIETYLWSVLSTCRNKFTISSIYYPIDFPMFSAYPNKMVNWRGQIFYLLTNAGEGIYRTIAHHWVFPKAYFKLRKVI